MAERTLTNQDVKGAIDLYKSLPAATFFRGLTGHGLISSSGVEEVGEITNSSGIWKPMYFFITGGEKSGRRTLTAEDIKKTVEKFVENELFALLKVTTGRGIKINNGMSQLVDIKEAVAGINFELTHFGGRSIVPRMEVELSALQDPSIKWQSGFLYQSQGNKAPVINKNLILTKVLDEEEFGSEEKFDRVWQDIDKEVKRLMFMQCDSDSLPASGDNNRSDRVRAFFSQELTILVPRVQIDIKKPGYEYSIRRDGTVVIQKSVRAFEYQDEQKFAEFMAEFTKECYRVYTLYCNPLTDAQRQKLGRPVSDTHGLIETGEGEFDRDDRRSTETNESLIMWLERRGAPNFPYEGWSPEKDKEYFVFRHRWGRGYRVSPAQAHYEWHYQDNGDETYSKVEFRIEFDGTEKEVLGTKSDAVQFKTRDEYVDGSWSSQELVIAGKGKGDILQTKTDHRHHYTETVSDDGSEIREKRLNDLTEEFPFERKVSVGDFEIKPDCDTCYSGGVIPGSSTPSNLFADQSKIKWVITGKAKSPDEDSEITCKLKIDDASSLDWEKVPDWLQAQQEKAYPLCKCGRERYDASSEVHECRVCHEYDDCPRCSHLRYYEAERKASGATCCSNCELWYEGREQWIHNHLSANDLQKIRDNAQTLLDAPAFCDLEDQSGEVLYPLAYGIYTSRFDDEVLEQLANLPDFGNSLVELIWWIARGSKQSGLSSSFTEETVTEFKNKLDTGENITARFVRASDEVIAVVGSLREELKDYFEYKTLKLDDPHPFNVADIEAKWSKVGFGDATPEKLEILKTLKKKLTVEVEEYRAELARQRQEAIDRGEIWPDVRIEISTESRDHTEVYCVAPDGSIVEPIGDECGHKERVCGYLYGDLPTDHLVITYGHDNYGYRYTEWWRVDYMPKDLTYAQRMVVEELEETREYFYGSGAGWNLRQVGTMTFTTVYSRDLQGADQETYERLYHELPLNVDEYVQWKGSDPYLPKDRQDELGSDVVVVGFAKKEESNKTAGNPAEASETNGSTASGQWEPAGMKYWYLCPQGHSTKIKNGQAGDSHQCDVCHGLFEIK